MRDELTTQQWIDRINLANKKRALSDQIPTKHLYEKLEKEKKKVLTKSS